MPKTREELISYNDNTDMKELFYSEQEVQELKDTITKLENLLSKFQNGTFVDISEVKKLLKENEELKESLLKLAKQRDELLIKSQKYNFQEYEKEIQELKIKLAVQNNKELQEDQDLLKTISGKTDKQNKNATF